MAATATRWPRSRLQWVASVALFDRPSRIYTHIDHVYSVVLQHERTTAVRVYFLDTDSTLVEIRAGEANIHVGLTYLIAI